jgi:hypothetical protein
MELDVNKQTCIFKQFSGLGDILYCQKIRVHYETNLNYNVIWPVIPEYSWISDYIEGNYPPPGDYGGDIVLDLQNANNQFKNSKIMAAKYELAGIDREDWADYFTFKRKPDKEDDLFYNVLGLKDDEEYYLVSNNYGTPPEYKKYDINLGDDKKVINLDFVDGFTLFDWSKVFENAVEIHTIDSSVNYIMEKLKLKAEGRLYIYSRRGTDYSQINYLFKQAWNSK